MALSLEQFKELRKKGLSTDQIVRFEKDTTKTETIRKSQEEAQRYAQEAQKAGSVWGLAKETAKGVGKTLLGFGKELVRTPLTTPLKVTQSLTEAMTGKTQVYTPETRVEKFLYGAEPRQSYQQDQESIQKFAEEKGVGRKTAIGLGALGAGAEVVMDVGLPEIGKTVGKVFSRTIKKILGKLDEEAPLLEKSLNEGKLDEDELAKIFEEEGIKGVKEKVSQEKVRTPRELKRGELAPEIAKIEEKTGKLSATKQLEAKAKIEEGYSADEIADEITTPKRTELTSKPVKVETPIQTDPLIQEANKPVYKSSRELANINKENYRKYVENLSKAQEFSDEAKHNYGLRTKNSWYNDELYERATNAESLVDSLYSKKDRYIIRAINNANKFKEKPVVSLKEGAIYFKTPAGQVSFHSPLLNIENKRFIKKLEKKVEFIDDYKWSGVKDDSRSVIGFLEENMGNNVNIQKYLQGKKEFVKKLENEIQNKISNLERGLPNKKVVLGKLEEAKKRGLKTDEYYSLYDFDFGSYADDQKLYVDFLKRGSVAVDDAINIKRQRELAYIKENEFEFPKRISKEIKQLENFYGIKTKSQPTDTSNKSNQTIPKSPSPKQTVKATPEIKAPKTKQSQYAQKVLDIEKDINKEIKASEFISGNREEQSKKATDLLSQGKEKILEVLGDRNKLPDDLKSGSLTIALEKFLAKNKDIDIMRAMADETSWLSKEISETGSNLSMMAERNSESPLKIIKDITKRRAKKTNKVKAKKEIKETTNKITIKIDKANKLLDKLMC